MFSNIYAHTLEQTPGRVCQMFTGVRLCSSMIHVLLSLPCVFGFPNFLQKICITPTITKEFEINIQEFIYIHKELPILCYQLVLWQKIKIKINKYFPLEFINLFLL